MASWRRDTTDVEAGNGGLSLTLTLLINGHKFEVGVPLLGNGADEDCRGSLIIPRLQSHTQKGLTYFTLHFAMSVTGKLPDEPGVCYLAFLEIDEIFHYLGALIPGEPPVESAMQIHELPERALVFFRKFPEPPEPYYLLPVVMRLVEDVSMILWCEPVHASLASSHLQNAARELPSYKKAMKCFGGEWNLFLENISSYLNLWHIFVYDDEEIEEHGLHGEECYRERRLVHPKYRKRVAESDSAYVRLGREARATLENRIRDRVMRCERCKHGRLCKECTEGLMKLPCTSALCWITAVHRVKRVTGSRGLLAWDPLLPLVVTDNPSDAIPGGL